MNNNNIGFLKRIRVKYNLHLVNENTLEEIRRFRLSGLSLFVLGAFLLIASFILFSLLIWFTPLKGLLPENIDPQLQEQVRYDALRIDSLNKEVYLREAYFISLNEILSGNLSVDSSITSDSLLLRRRDEQFIDKSADESNFVDKFEKEEQYNLITVSNNKLDKSDMVFFCPVKGIITREFNANKGHLGIDISVVNNTSVSSIYKGVVSVTGYDPQVGYFIQVLHKDGYTSLYKGASQVFKSSGDVVKTGEVIAIIQENSTALDKPALHFELWSGTQAQNPENYIIFE